MALSDDGEDRGIHRSKAERKQTDRRSQIVPASGSGFGVWRCLDEASEIGVRKRCEGVAQAEFPDGGRRCAQREGRFLRARL